MTRNMFLAIMLGGIVLPLAGLSVVTYEYGRTEGIIAAAQSRIKKFKVTLSKSDKGSNRVVYIDAETSDEARKIAREQNPGWQVEACEEVK